MRSRLSSLALHAALAAFAACTTGCQGWARGAFGGAYNVADRPGQSGYIASIDGAIRMPPVKEVNGGRPLPLGVQTSLDLMGAPDRKSIGWGSGVAVYTSPKPVSPYVIGGTSLHFDVVDGKFSFGNLSPYAEFGILASVPSRYDEEDHGWGAIVTLGVAGASYFNYLLHDGIDGYALVRLGIGWEKF